MIILLLHEIIGNDVTVYSPWHTQDEPLPLAHQNLWFSLQNIPIFAKYLYLIVFNPNNIQKSTINTSQSFHTFHVMWQTCLQTIRWQLIVFVLKYKVQGKFSVAVQCQWPGFSSWCYLQGAYLYSEEHLVLQFFQISPTFHRDLIWVTTFWGCYIGTECTPTFASCLPQILGLWLCLIKRQISQYNSMHIWQLKWIFNLWNQYSNDP